MTTGQDSERRLLNELADSAELHLAQNYFGRFLPFVRILEPPPGRGNIAFEPWSRLMEVCDILDTKIRVRARIKAMDHSSSTIFRPSWVLVAT